VTDEGSGTALPLRAQNPVEARRWYESLVSAIREAKALTASLSEPLYSPFAGAVWRHWLRRRLRKSVVLSCALGTATRTPSHNTTTLRVEYAERRKVYRIVFIFGLF